MRTIILASLLVVLTWTGALSQTTKSGSDYFEFARSRKNDLKLSTYATAHCINEFFSTQEGRKKVLATLKNNGISKVYLEVYRSGLVLKPDSLKKYIQFIKENGFEVVGGIATVPGDDFAKKQEGPLTWCNWQNKKTQDDFREVMINVAPLFDTFVIDDFLCTSDTSIESKTAKGNQSWSVYRRALLTRLQDELFIRPAKKANPGLKIIIKYPQWYDRFHMFGYDVETGPKLFDEVWVGTESRGQYTQRYGFVQPYEGFINYRWISTFGGKKMGGAWFDYGDCNADDFVEQAYQSVLAGAKELVFFSMYDLLQDHPGNRLLQQKFSQLADLSKTVSQYPVTGTVGYKPAQSDAGGDLYLLDGLGMFGVSLVPASSYPADAKVILLPTQAAADKDIVRKIEASLEKGSRLILTAGFLANAAQGEKIARLAGVEWPVTISPSEAPEIITNNQSLAMKLPLKLESMLKTKGSTVLLEAKNGNSRIPFLLKNSAGNIYVLNVHTFSEADFAAVGEVLLSPRQLGIYDVPKDWANTLRSALQISSLPVMDAPARVSFQQLNDGSFVVQNYNMAPAEVKLTLKQEGKLRDRFDAKEMTIKENRLTVTIPARSRVWIGK
jgi:hypothetical protein